LREHTRDARTLKAQWWLGGSHPADATVWFV